MTRTRSILAALVLLIAVPATALGANQTVPTSETLTVLATTTLTGVPASISYGSSLTGATVPSASTYQFIATSNNGTGFTVAWQPGTLSAGANTIAATNNRSIQLSSAGSAPCATVGALSGYSTAPGKLYIAAAGTPQTFVSATTNASCTITGIVLHIAIPAATVAGAYTGTSNFIVTENP